jgi:hypothetical protein
MTSEQPAPVDPEIAAITIGRHLDDLWATPTPSRRGWGRLALDSLRHVVALPARATGGATAHYFALLDARCYDLWPVDVAFVDPSDWKPVSAGRWLPQIKPEPTSRFAMHARYSFPDQSIRQLVCFSGTLGYYESAHAPTESQRWRQGKHTVAATLFRLDEMLGPDYYLGPSE